MNNNMEKTHLPKRFEAMMQDKLGPMSYEAFLSALAEKPPTAIRIHPVKGKHLFEDEARVPWCTYGRYLKERPAFVWDPLYHAGAYYAQEASSMLFANAIDFSKDLRVLDLCAAPGGKSSLLLSFLSENSLLVSNELVGKRASILYENLVKWGGTNNIITNNRVSDFAPFKGFFDVVMIDAPCSGEGMFRKDRDAVAQWSEGLVAQCSIVQKEILTHALELIRPGGLLIYSTCTFENSENEDNIKWLYHNYGNRLQPRAIATKKDWGVFEVEIKTQSGNTQTGYYCYPHLLKGEGQFIAAMEVTDNSAFKDKGKSHRKNIRPLSQGELQFIKPFVQNNELLDYFLYADDKVIVLPQAVQHDALLFESMYLKKMGTLAGRLIRNNFIADHELIMAGLASDQFPRITLNREQALDFMQRKNIDIPNSAPAGWVIFRYLDTDIGLAKNLGNRINNHYPSEWRIRKEPQY
jgi:16S rRNA C967 or C1407 C5-methylase (RsmB/RsmF family)/NOL1/NOP2/fmu family ribosome biogenesis protein